MNALWTVSPIKGKFHMIYGYAVVRGYGKAREEAIRFEATPERPAEKAFEAANDVAALLNNGE